MQATEGKVSFTWSEGPSFFDPYHLTGDAADEISNRAAPAPAPGRVHRSPDDAAWAAEEGI